MPPAEFLSASPPVPILNSPFHSAAAVLEPAPTPPKSAVSLEFLRAFMRRIPGGAAGGATMTRVVEELVRPSTSATMGRWDQGGVGRGGYRGVRGKRGVRSMPQCS
jgi:hypothetical protein